MISRVEPTVSEERAVRNDIIKKQQAEIERLTAELSYAARTIANGSAGGSGLCITCAAHVTVIEDLTAERDRLAARLSLWEAACTGRNGSQCPCVQPDTSGDSNG